MKPLATTTILLGLALAAGGCTCNGETSTDGAVVKLDLGLDSWRDGAPDQTIRYDAGGDAPTDAFFDRMNHDLVFHDSKLASATVLYTPATQASTFGLRRVATDGNGAPVQVSGWAGYIDFEALYLTGLQESLPITRTVPQPASELDTEFAGIALPGKLGSVHYYHDKLKGTSGLMQVTAGGTITTLLETTGVYKETISDRVALTADGKLGAALADNKQVLLFRTDGSTFTASGKPAVDVSPAATLGLTSVKPHSLTLVGSYLYCVGQVTGGADMLLRAPQDGSAALTQVTLPKVSDKAVLHISDGLAVSADGSTLVVPAGGSTVLRDLIAVDVASGTATNLTQSPGQIAERGNELGKLSAQLALSTKGSYAAYVAVNQELFVVKTDGSSKPVQISDQTHFKAGVVLHVNLLFIDDQTLLWMAGEDIDQLDLFRLDCAKNHVYNLSGYGSTTEPFDGSGAIRPRAIWRSPNGKWLYWIEYLSNPDTTDIRALDLATFKNYAVTSQADVKFNPGAMAACPTSGKLYFVAEPDPVKNNHEIWVHDRDHGDTKAVKLTTMSNTPTSTWYVFNLRLSDDCKWLAWTAGGSYWLRNIWLQDTGKGPGTAQKVTTPPLFIHQSFRFTPDSSTLVFGSGGSHDSSTLKAVALPPGKAKTLDTTSGYTHIFAVY